MRSSKLKSAVVTMGSFALGVFLALPLLAQAQGTAPKLVATQFSEGFIPEGFDTNDHVQIVAEGVFRNSCFRPAASDVEVDHAHKLIKVRAKAYQYRGVCAEVMVRYDQVLNLGLMKTGTYQVVQTETGKKIGDVKIKVAPNSSADEFLYAPVSQAFVEKKGSETTVKVSGSFPNNCMKLVDVMVNVQPKVVVVQPIAEIEQRSNCTAGNFPFSRETQIPNLKNGRYLLHVRSLNANAINSMFDMGEMDF